MKQPVVLSIRGRQSYEGQEPDVIELVTEGTMAFVDGGWDISYEETELTGMAGVTTTFRVEPGKITLTRTGKLNSQMVFQEGTVHESLYQMEYGALMISVCATEAMYYHVANKDKKCEERIAKIYAEMTEEFPIMDAFDDIYDYCKTVLILRDKKEELWKILDLIEPSVKKLDIANIVLKTLALKIEYYRKHQIQMEYLETSAQYYEYCLRAGVENRNAMNNVINIRKSLELVNREKAEMLEKNAFLQKKSET